MADELDEVAAGAFDVVPAVKLLALRLMQLERDLGKLVVTEPVDDMRMVSIGGRFPAARRELADTAPAVLVEGTPEQAASKRASNKKVAT